MKKRITYKEWEYISKHNPVTKWSRPLCSYSLVEIEDGFRRECKISWPVYLILFIPAHLFQALWCMWDGGLIEFELIGRHLGYDDIKEHTGSNIEAFPKAKEIWEKY